jgi:hypothetical protein
VRAWRWHRRVGGVTLLEVVVALAVVALALLAWVRLEGHLAQVEHSTRIRRQLAAWMSDELRLQRAVRSLGCRSRPAPPGWSCIVERSCLEASAPCEMEGIRVTLTPPGGPPWSGATAVWWPLQRAPVEAPP